MGRPRKPRRPQHRPNKLDPKVLLWLDRIGGRGQPRNFPWRHVGVSRRAVYFSFERLRVNGVVNRIRDHPLTYKVAEPALVPTQIFELWQKVDPPRLGSPTESSKTHRKMKRSFAETCRNYDRLPEQLREEFSDNICINEQTKLPMTTDLLFIDKALEVEQRVRTLQTEYKEVEDEKRWKDIPSSIRPEDWKGWRSPKRTYKREILSQDQNIKADFSNAYLAMNELKCAECDTNMIFDKSLRVFVCPKCGFENVI